MLLKSLTLRGYKTISELRDFCPGQLTVLIGPNGAGKSNLISFFRFLSWSLSPPGQLQEYLARQGGASSLLHDGPSKTREIETDIRIETGTGRNDYFFRLAYASGDTLIYTEEKYRFSKSEYETDYGWTDLGAGHREPAINQRSESGDKVAHTIHRLLRRIIVHQFHNTSDTARIRQKWSVDEGRWLKEDAGNLAPFLLRLRNEAPQAYHRIAESVRLALPFFADFELQNERNSVMLTWREKGSDVVFHAGQAADGMLRLLALLTVLQQPEADLPDVLILDEPELGLHPFAIAMVADLMKGLSSKTQLIVATQSVSLIDRLEPEDVVVVSRENRGSQFHRLDPGKLKDWIQDYSLSELWEKNVIGGRP